MTTLNENIKIDNCHPNKFCWSAIIAGALVGIGISFLLNLFALAIGATAFIYTDTTQAFAIGGFIALAIIAIASMGTLGWVSGSLGAKNCTYNSNQAQSYTNTHCHSGCLYGFTAWCLALIFTIFLSAPITKFLYFNRIAISHPNYIVDNQENGSQSAQTIRSTDNDVNVNKTLTQEEATKTFAMTTFVAFVLFLIGALSATIAGHWAFNACYRHKREQHPIM